MATTEQQAKEQLLNVLLQELEQKRFILPTLPELAFKIRQAMDSPRTTMEALSRIISADPAIAGRVVQMANSALFAGLPKVETIQAAIGRLGMACTSNIVISLSMARLYSLGKAANTRLHLAEQWSMAAQVAAISSVIAKLHTRLDPYEALLAGLLHNIGSLPVIVTCAERADVQAIPDLLPLLVDSVMADLGSWILKQWGFAEAFCLVPAEHRNLSREHAGKADLVDVVTVAALLAYYRKVPSMEQQVWLGISAFERLGLTPDTGVAVLKEANVAISEIMQILS